MVSFSDTLAIAEMLSRIWILHKQDSFKKYILDIYGLRLSRIPCFKCIYIAHILNGDASQGVIGTEVDRWWIVDDDGMREDDADRYEFIESDGFYTTPFMKFLMSDKWLAIGERLGPRIGCRKIGRVDTTNDNVQINDIKVVWAYGKGLERPIT